MKSRLEVLSSVPDRQSGVVDWSNEDVVVCRMDVCCFEGTRKMHAAFVLALV